MQEGGWGPVPTGQRASLPAVSHTGVAAAWSIFAGAALVVVFLYPLAVSFIDRPRPQTVAAALFLLLIIAACVPAVLATRHAQPETWRRLVFIALVAAVLPAIFAATIQEQAYGFLGFIAILFYVGIPLAVLAAVGLIVALVQQVSGRSTAAVRTIHLIGLWLLGVVAMVSVWLLVTLPRQAELARQAHEMPFGAAALLLAVVAVIVLLQRRR